MNEVKLQAGDVLVNVNHKKDIWARIRRWATGPYSHVFLYMGKLGLLVYLRQGRLLRFPMLFESNGRGVALQSLSNRYSQEVVVMRLKPEYQGKVPRVLTEAVKLASDEKARYDYFCIVKFILPRIICEKLRLSMPLKYQRNTAMICSECVAEIFWRAGVEIVPKNIVSLPSSFVETDLLTRVWEGELSIDLL